MYKDVVSELIKETPPDGKEFLKTVEKILQVPRASTKNQSVSLRALIYIVFESQREECWNEWKNKSCPEVKKPNPVSMDIENGIRSKEPHLGDVLKEYHSQKKYFMGK